MDDPVTYFNKFPENKIQCGRGEDQHGKIKPPKYYEFHNGTLTLTDEKEIAELEKHPLFGKRFYRLGGVKVPARTAYNEGRQGVDDLKGKEATVVSPAPIPAAAPAPPESAPSDDETAASPLPPDVFGD